MAKFAVLFFAALAFQAVFAQHYYYHQHQQHGSSAEDLLSQVQSVSREAINAIQTAVTHQHTHVLYSQANEFAHNIHEVTYRLQHVIHHSEEGHSQQLLEHVVRIFSEAVHSIEQAIHQEPTELKAQLKLQIQNVAAEAQRLVQVVQQEQTGAHHVAEEVKDALDDLLSSIQQLQIRNAIENRSQEEIKNQIQTVTTQAVNAIQSVNTNGEDVAERLVHHAHHYGHHIGEVVHKLQKEVYHHNIHDQQVQTVLQQVISSLGQIHDFLGHIGQQSQETYGHVYGSLEHVGHHSQEGLGQIRGSLEHVRHHTQEGLGQTHGSIDHVDHHSQDNYGHIVDSVQHAGQHSENRFDHIRDSLHIGQHSQEGLGQIEQTGQHSQVATGQVIQKLETSVLGVAVQLGRLVQLVQYDIKEQESHNVRDLVHSVVAHTLVATKQLQRHVEHTVHHVNYINQEI